MAKCKAKGPRDDILVERVGLITQQSLRQTPGWSLISERKVVCI